jgi:GTPase SAR1 family protein
MIASANPFRADRVEALPFHFVDESWDALLARLEARRWRGALVGPKGSGKTTLLESLRRHFEQRGMVVTALRLSAPDGPRPETPPNPLPWRRLACLGPCDAVLLDGAEQLAWPAWWRLRATTRRAGALVVTAHRGGRLPAVAITRTTPALLEALVRALIAPAHLPAPVIQSLFERHQGNLRDALAALYDDWSLRQPPNPTFGRTGPR